MSGRFAGPFLCRGTRKLVFHSEGKLPVISMRLKNFERIGLRSGRECFITSFMFPSMKADLPFLSDLPNLVMQSGSYPSCKGVCGCLLECVWLVQAMYVGGA